MAAMRRLFEPLDLGSFMVRNRIVWPTHNPRLSDERELDYLARRAEGGVGLIGLQASQGVIQYAIGPGTPGRLGEWDRKPPSSVTSEGVAFYDDLVIPRIRARAEVIHEREAHCFAQVAHPGAARHWAAIDPAIGPSQIPDPYDGPIPHAMSEEVIEELIFSFAHAIRRIAEAGVDAAEIHGAHGYLVQQFLSPYSNRRKDRWGGSLENRVRFVREIIAAARKFVGDFPIGLRLGFEGYGEGQGLTPNLATETAIQLAPELAYLSISGGSYSGLSDGFTGGYVSPWYREPAYNADVAAKVRSRVQIPVLLTGRIADAALADSLIAEESADLIGMVRALIADPDLPKKAKAGRDIHIRMCLGLSECHHAGKHRVAMTCAVNAASGREAELAIEPAAEPKTVVVVGAGPAGLEAARVAAIRGHQVYLGDENRQIGGTPRLLARDPARHNLLDHAAFFEAALPQLSIELLLGHRVDVDDIEQFGADVVILATGSRSAVPEIPGLESWRGTRVLTDREVLAGGSLPSEHVLVVTGIDQSVAGPSLADHLAERGHRVSLVSELADFAPGVEDTTRLTLLQRLKRRHVSIEGTSRLRKYDESGASIVDTFTQERRHVPDVSVVLAAGAVSDDSLYRELKARGIACQVIGDALAPRRIMHATIEGARAGVTI